MSVRGELVEMLAKALNRARRETPPMRMRNFGVRGADAPSIQADLFAGAPEPPLIYHGTYNQQFDPQEIAPWSHFGTENAARERLKAVAPTNPLFAPSEGSDRILPFDLYGRSVNIGAEPPGNFTSAGNVSDQLHIANQLLRLGHLTPEEHAWAIEPATYGSRFEGRNSGEAVQERLADLLEKRDIAALSYTNSIEDRGRPSYIVPNPRASLRPSFPVFGAALGAGLGGAVTLRQALSDRMNA